MSKSVWPILLYFVLSPGILAAPPESGANNPGTGSLRLTVPKDEASPPVEDLKALRGLGTVKITAAEVAGEEQKTEEEKGEGAEQSQEEVIRKFLESAKIDGVRTAGKDSKMLFNGVIVEQGDLVAPRLGLRLVRITAQRILFEDDQGNVYPIRY